MTREQLQMALRLQSVAYRLLLWLNEQARRQPARAGGMCARTEKTVLTVWHTSRQRDGLTRRSRAGRDPGHEQNR